MPDREYICASCGTVCTHSDYSEKEQVQEYETVFKVEYKEEDIVEVCDTCYKQIMYRFAKMN